MGYKADRARPTFVGAFWLASLIAAPVGLIGLCIDLLLGIL